MGMLIGSEWRCFPVVEFASITDNALSLTSLDLKNSKAETLRKT